MPATVARSEYSHDAQHEASPRTIPPGRRRRDAATGAARPRSNRAAAAPPSRYPAPRPPASRDSASRHPAPRHLDNDFYEPPVAADAASAEETNWAAEERARAARRRARRAHRPLRVPLSTGVVGFLLLSQLLALLWLKGLALSATRRLDSLGDETHGEIGRANDAIAQTQKKVAALTSPAQLKKWAGQRGWRLATPREFNDITKRIPPPPADADAPSGNVPPNGASALGSGGAGSGGDQNAKSERRPGDDDNEVQR